MLCTCCITAANSKLMQSVTTGDCQLPSESQNLNALPTYIYASLKHYIIFTCVYTPVPPLQVLLTLVLGKDVGHII